MSSARSAAPAGFKAAANIAFRAAATVTVQGLNLAGQRAVSDNVGRGVPQPCLACMDYSIVMRPAGEIRQWDQQSQYTTFELGIIRDNIATSAATAIVAPGMVFGSGAFQFGVGYHYRGTDMMVNGGLDMVGGATSLILNLRSAAKGALTFNEGVLDNFTKHAFTNGRHADLGLSVQSMTSKAYNLIEQNMALLKVGDNTLIGNINGVQKSLKAFVRDGKIMSINMYPGISNRVTNGSIIKFGNVKW